MTPAETPEAISVGAGSLLLDYGTNEVAADPKYKNRILAVRGAIGTISKDFMDNPIVALLGDDPAQGLLYCYFDKKVNTDKLAQLRTGNIVVIRGRCQGRCIGLVSLKDCQIAEEKDAEIGRASSAQPGAQTVSQPPGDSAIEATALARNYGQFLGKRVKVKGYIVTSDSYPFLLVVLGDKGDGDRSAVGDYASVNNGHLVTCGFGGKDRVPGFYPVPGQMVTVVGTCAREHGEVGLLDCTVVKEAAIK